MLEVEVVWAGMLRQNRRKKRDIEINGIDNSDDDSEKNLDQIIEESWEEAKEKTKKDIIKGDKKEMLGFLNKKKTPTQKKQNEVILPETNLETIENVKEYKIPYKSIREDITKETKEEARNNNLS